MTYTATISSKGQITIPAEVRRKLNLDKKVRMELRDNMLILESPPTMEDIWAVLDVPISSQGHTQNSNRAWAQGARAKDKNKRGY